MTLQSHSTKVLYLTKYARNGASSRYRSFNYLPYLEQNNIHYKVSSLFDEQYLINYYQTGHANIGDVLRAFLRRLKILLSLNSYNLVVIEYEILPYFPAVLERFLNVIKLPYVVDYDDALFHQYDQHRLAIVRWLLGGKIAQVMRHAATVVAGNAYLADYARSAGSSAVEIIPTVIDLDRYPINLTSADLNRVFTIGWIGSPSTSVYLEAIAPALAALCADHQVKVCLIGATNVILPGVNVETIAWSESTEVSLMQQFDVGIMPLPDEPWARGKCGFKLIQYMACGLPIVASPVGVNCEIVEQGINGFLAQTPEEWQNALLTLLRDKVLRERMGLAGRQKVERKYCLQVTAPKFVNLLLGVAVNAKK